MGHVAEPHPDLAHAERRERFRMVVVIAVPILLACASTVIYVTLTGVSGTTAQYRLVLGLLCFTLSTVSGLWPSPDSEDSLTTLLELAVHTLPG